MYLNEEKLNEVIFVTTVNAVQLVWEQGLVIDTEKIRPHILEALAVMMGDVIYEYEYVNKVIDATFDFLLKDRTHALTKISFGNGFIDSKLLN